MRYLPWSIAICLVVALAACSSGGGSNSSNGLFTPASSSRVSSGHGKVSAKIVIHVPRKRAKDHARGGKFISPSTQSIVITTQDTTAAGQPVTSAVNLASSADCNGNGASAPYDCTISIGSLVPGDTYSLTFVTRDLAQPANPPFTAGQALAENVVSKKIVAGADNTIGITLGGIPHAFKVAPAPGSTVAGGSETDGISFIGEGSARVLVSTLDADGNYIVGPGAPVVTASIVPGATGGIAVASPSPSGNPQAFTLSSSGFSGFLPNGNIAWSTLNLTAKNPAPTGGSYGPVAINVFAGVYEKVIAGQANNNSCVNSDGTGSSAGFCSPLGIALGADGNLYVSDFFNCSIRKVTPVGVVTTVAGGSANNCGYAEGPAARALFSQPSGVGFDGSGSLYVADAGNQAVRAISGGSVSTLTGGNGAGNTNGAPNVAQFAFNVNCCPYPMAGIAFDPDNSSLYIADTGNCTIRQVTLAGAGAGTVATIAGTGTCGYNTDSGASGTTVEFNQPAGIAFVHGASDVLYVGDSNNCKVRSISTTGSNAVATVAGSTCGYSDGAGAAAQFDSVQGVTFDSTDGALYVTDPNNCNVRQVLISGANAGLVTTVGGNTYLCGSFNGFTPATPVNGAAGIVYDAALNSLFFTDQYNQVVTEAQL
jgi:hypothetical protein